MADPRVNFFNFKNKAVLVMGLGLHGGGLATVKWLLKHGAAVTVTDLKTEAKLQSSLDRLTGAERRRLKLVLGQHRVSDFKRAAVVIQNPGVPRSSIYLRLAKKSGAMIENEASLFFKRCPAPIIGVTGTRGKSTTAALIAALLKNKNQPVWLAGLPQKPMLGLLDRIRPSDLVVLELSSWQLEILGQHRLSPPVAVFTNFYPDHLDRYPTIIAYRQAKQQILNHQPATASAVLNFDNQTTQTIGRQVRSQRFWFSKKYFAEQNGCFIQNGAVVFRYQGRTQKLFKISAIRLRGTHNLENVLAAACVAAMHHASPRRLTAAVKHFGGLSNHLETIGQSHGVSYVNDTTATTPQATIAALNTIKSGVVLIAGGASKKIPVAQYRPLARLIAKHCRAVVLFNGAGSPLISRPLQALGFRPLVTKVATMVEAVSVAKSLSRRGDTVLLSPASASFGLFINEFDRGQQFNAAVTSLCR